MRKEKKLKIGILSLGCPKNLVDSEVLLGLIKKAGHEIQESIAASDIAVLNTCSFIKESKEESIDRLMELVEMKKEGRIKHIIVCGCLSQRYHQQLRNEVTEIDALVGTGELHRINEVIERVLKGDKPDFIGVPSYLYDDKAARLSLTPKHWKYIKIAEGCNNCCSYCVIPALRGKYRSRSIPSIVEEARKLSRKGMKELNITGQDITYFGKDTDGKFMLSELLKELVKIRGLRWIRLLYTHPAHFTDELIDVIANEKKICKYIDLPLQHINDRVLESMRRYTTKKQIYSLIEKLKSKIDGLALRTSFIVGYPGETKSEFNEIITAMKEIRFERLGIFTYSREEGTKAYSLTRQIPENVKKERLNEAMVLQQEISTEFNKTLIGKCMEVLIEERRQNDYNNFLGRTYMDAPEVDGLVYLNGKKLRHKKAGDFVKAVITDSYEYDLVGKVV